MIVFVSKNRLSPVDGGSEDRRTGDQCLGGV